MCLKRICSAMAWGLALCLAGAAPVVADVTALGQQVLRVAAGTVVLDDRACVLGRQRAAVVALERRHRSDVTGSQALEGTHVKLPVGARAVGSRAGRLA